MDGANIARLRKAAGMTQEELAELLGVHIVTLNRWERGHFEPKGSILTKIAEVLKTTEAELLHGPKEEDEWKLTIKMGGTKEMIDLAGNACVSDIELAQNGAALRLGGSYAVFEDDEKFEDFIRQLRSARDLVIESGRKMRNIKNKAVE